MFYFLQDRSVIVVIDVKTLEQWRCLSFSHLNKTIVVIINKNTIESMCIGYQVTIVCCCRQRKDFFFFCLGHVLKNSLTHLFVKGKEKMIVNFILNVSLPSCNSRYPRCLMYDLKSDVIVYKLGDECRLKTVWCQPASSVFTSQIVFLSKLLKWTTVYIRRLHLLFILSLQTEENSCSIIRGSFKFRSNWRFLISIIDENISTTLRNCMHSVILFVATVLIRLIRL